MNVRQELLEGIRTGAADKLQASHNRQSDSSDGSGSPNELVTPTVLKVNPPSPPPAHPSLFTHYTHVHLQN